MKVHLSKTISVIVLIGLLAGAAMLAFPAAVSAQSGQPGDPTQTAPAPANQQKVIARLEKEYQAELKTVETQASRLSKADTFAGKAQQRIDNLKSQGKDVSVLTAALSVFQTVLKSAHTDHDSAAAVLKNHAGFDANGKVTDIPLARSTVQEAHRLLRQARQDVRPAARDLVHAIRQFVRSHRGQ